MRGRRESKGFTLIELLVVIAIIGILAAMVFPVFARARESARKAVCLSNVKNIGLAIQMYLADNNDTFPPFESRTDVRDYIATQVGYDCGEEGYRKHNPFLAWPVVLDEYTKNRDVWRCPSAKLVTGPAYIIPNYGPGGWLGYLKSPEGEWGWLSGDEYPYTIEPCRGAFPPGWGGDVTDSFVQQRMAVAGAGLYGAGREGSSSATELTIACAEATLTGKKMAQLENPTNWVVAGDSFGIRLGAPIYTIFEVCRFFPTCDPDTAYATSDCPWSLQCGLTYDQAVQFGDDRTFQKRYIRHLSGVNLAFADGHASWWNAYTLFEKVRPARVWDSSWANPCPLSVPEDADSIYGFEEDCTYGSQWE